MAAPLRRTLLCLLVAALAFLAHAPLFGSGFVRGDLELLACAAGRADLAPDAGAWLADGDVRPIPAAILRVHAELHTGLSPLERAVAAPYFAFALVVLLLAAGGAGVTLRRVLVPWLGESAARAAGWACAGLVVAHPASVAVVARPIALGDLVALAAGTWCTAFFLRGRQQRRDRFLVIAGVLAVVAGFASSAAWMLPFACAGLEFTSAHRPRAFGRRLVAALTVALVASLAVAIEAGFAWSHGFGTRAGTPWEVYHAGFATGGDAFDVAFDRGLDPIAALNVLGLLFVPVSSTGTAGAYLACGAVLLLAAEPLLRAVRAAPRLWGWLVLGWLISVGTALVLTRELVVPAGRIDLGVTLLPAGILVCVALATAATALGGSRRTVIPLAIAAGLCILSDRTARIWPERSAQLLRLRGDLERALGTAGPGGVVYAVSPPLDVDRVRSADEWRLARLDRPPDLDLIGGPWPGDASWRLRSERSDNLPYTVRLPSSAETLRRGVAVLLLDREERPVFKLAAPIGDGKPFTWREEGRSELVELDPIALTMVRVTPRTGISTAESPRMCWRSTNATFENGSIEGAWVATDDGPQAIFDLGRSLEWLLGGTIRRVWFEGELRKIVTAEVLPRIPVEGVTELPLDLVFDVPEERRPRPWMGEASWHLISIGPPIEDLPASPSGGGEDRLLRFRTSTPYYCMGPGPTYVLECRAGGVTIARSASFEPRGW